MAESNGFLSVFRNATRRTFSSQNETTGVSESSSLSSLAWATSNLLQPVTLTIRSQLWQIWCSAKPWSEFANSKKLKAPTDAADVRDRVFSNLRFYLPNYVLLFVALSSLSILLRPFIVIAVLLIAFLYAYLFVLNPTPLSWGPIHLNSQLKMVVLTVVAVFLIWITGAVYVITSWLGVAFVIAVAHAVMHLPADEPDFETTV
ncbi:hypothetical protein GpartN1_g5482.t1 [Galdieria partita]|uniref:PRA1 family protein n=1 Tax=Galdieria partita TaxID=83374 RepID=A0A9C7US57_9RHOD|nr:hypothetical protein GpartN1_g5482.t1 [Galdieria partita]